MALLLNHKGVHFNRVVQWTSAPVEPMNYEIAPYIFCLIFTHWRGSQAYTYCTGPGPLNPAFPDGYTTGGVVVPNFHGATVPMDHNSKDFSIGGVILPSAISTNACGGTFQEGGSSGSSTCSFTSTTPTPLTGTDSLKYNKCSLLKYAGVENGAQIILPYPVPYTFLSKIYKWAAGVKGSATIRESRSTPGRWMLVIPRPWARSMRGDRAYLLIQWRAAPPLYGHLGA